MAAVRRETRALSPTGRVELQSSEQRDGAGHLSRITAGSPMSTSSTSSTPRPVSPSVPCPSRSVSPSVSPSVSVRDFDSLPDLHLTLPLSPTDASSQEDALDQL
jgi:hypothetical protein